MSFGEIFASVLTGILLGQITVVLFRTNRLLFFKNEILEVQLEKIKNENNTLVVG